MWPAVTCCMYTLEAPVICRRADHLNVGHWVMKMTTQKKILNSLICKIQLILDHFLSIFLFVSPVSLSVLPTRFIICSAFHSRGVNWGQSDSLMLSNPLNVKKKKKRPRACAPGGNSLLFSVKSSFQMQLNGFEVPWMCSSCVSPVPATHSSYLKCKIFSICILVSISFLFSALHSSSSSVIHAQNLALL